MDIENIWLCEGWRNGIKKLKSPKRFYTCSHVYLHEKNGGCDMICGACVLSEPNPKCYCCKKVSYEEILEYLTIVIE